VSPKLRPLLLVFALAGAACGNGGSKNTDDAAEADAVDAAVRAAREALAAGDVDGFLAVWTDDGLQQVFHEFGDAFVANTGYYVGTKQYSLGTSSAPTVVGDTATTVAPLFFRLVGVTREFSLVKVEGTWRIDGSALATADVGEATAIDVAFGESSIVSDELTTAPQGDIALQVRNPTTRLHDLMILTAPPGADVATLFLHPESAPPLPEGRSMPEGFDFVGGVSGIEPGGRVTVVFSTRLPAARYFVFCNSEDGEAGVPHSQRGEFLEFTIP
jgi:hypothetical protein